MKSGTNSISAVFVAPGGEGPRSNVVTLTVDDVAPHISLTQPQDHAVVNAPSVTLVGQTDAGANIAVSNLTAAHNGTATAGSDGQFSVVIALEPGGNDLELTATDLAGNTGRLELTLTRGSGSLDAQLSLSRDVFRPGNCRRHST